MGGGFCFKLSQRQNYAFSDYLEAVTMGICAKNQIKYQKWSQKTYKAGGGTIANIVAADADAKVVDCGVPMLAMHSCQELVDLDDLAQFQKFFIAVLEIGRAHV